MEPTDDLDAADVVVLNTCCIRENADNKLYGHLGRLKALKDARPDLQIAVGGCLAQKDRELVRERAPHVDVVFGTHNLAHAPELLARARREGPLVEILEEHEAYPSALPARREVDHSAWVTIQIGCDNSCAFCIVPSVRGQRGEPADGRHRARGRRARPRRRASRSRCSARTSTPTAATSAPGSTARSSPTCCARSTRSTASSASASRRRTPRTCGPRRSRRWPSARSVCEHLHLPLQSGSDRTLARMHRGYTADALPRAARRGPRRDRRPRGHHRHHRRLPGRDRRRLRRRRSRSRRSRDYDAAYTFVFSPRPGTEAADDDRRLRRPRSRAGTDAPPGRSRRAARAARSTTARVGVVEEVLVDGPSKTDAAMWSGRTRQNKLAALRARADDARPGDLVDVARHERRAALAARRDDRAASARRRRRRVRIPVVVV